MTKSSNLFFLALVPCLACVCIGWFAYSHAQSSSVKSDPLRDLMLERTETLFKRAEIYDALVLSARAVPLEALDAHRDHILSAIESANSIEERIPLLEALVENRKKVEESYIAKKHMAQANESEVMLAKSNRLSAQIDLQRAMSTPESK